MTVRRFGAPVGASGGGCGPPNTEISSASGGCGHAGRRSEGRNRSPGADCGTVPPWATRAAVTAAATSSPSRRDRAAGSAGASVVAVAGPVASPAAPRATAYFGCASSTVGRPSASEIMCATSGIRVEPPTSSTAASSLGSTCADSSVRISVLIVVSTGVRIMASKSALLSCTSACRLGRNTAIVVSSSTDSVSLAATHSWRSRATVATFCGSRMSSAVSAPPVAVLTWARIASSKLPPPSCSMPSARPTISIRPASLRSTVASKVPPPRSYTAIVAPSANRPDAAWCAAAASGSVIICTSARPAIRGMRPNSSRRPASQCAGWVSTTRSGPAPVPCSARSTTSPRIAPSSAVTS